MDHHHLAVLVRNLRLELVPVLNQFVPAFLHIQDEVFQLLREIGPTVFLAEGREAYKKLGAVREEFLKYARKPLPEELP
nr:hypothetical protein [uncultured Oscillibacter sp.]